jgi:hypothetical protein
MLLAVQGAGISRVPQFWSTCVGMFRGAGSADAIVGVKLIPITTKVVTARELRRFLIFISDAISLVGNSSQPRVITQLSPHELTTDAVLMHKGENPAPVRRNWVIRA